MEGKDGEPSERPLLAPPAKLERKCKSAAEMVETNRRCDQTRAQPRVNIESWFDRWRRLREHMGLKSDAETAEFLLNRYGKVLNKKSCKWSLYTIKEDKVYAYMKDLRRAIIKRRLSTSSVPRQSKKRPDDPRQHVVLPGVPAPTTEELLETQLSRGQGQSLPK